MRAWRAFLEAHAAVIDVLEAELERHQGLPLTWYDVLVQLSEAPRGKRRMQDLARSVLLSKSGLTRLIDRMERAGFVRRERCADDARGVIAALTPAGRARLRAAAPVHLRGVEQHFAAQLADGEAQVVAKAMERVARVLGRAAPEAERTRVPQH